MSAPRIHIVVRTSGKSRNVLARGTWWSVSLPYWHALTAFGNAMREARQHEPHNGVAVLIRRLP